MILTLTPEKGGEPFQVELQRNGTVDLPDGTKIAYTAFFPDFAMVEGKPDTRSGDYNNPAVLLGVTAPGAAEGEVKNAYAFERKLPDGVPVGAPVAGYKYKLTSYQKSPLAHVLSIKYDPWYGHIIAWYVGGFGVIGMLVLIYFFAHRRVWGVVEKVSDGKYKIHLGGNTNRNHFKFEDQFKKITAELGK
jgi:cytochrome c biogenesis protein ResB